MMNQIELEREISRMALAMRSRNRQLGNDLIEHLRTQLTLEGVAGVIVVSIERLLWFDIDSVFWTIQHLIPADVMQEIHKMTSIAVSKRLIGKGLMPGKDFSVDGAGKLILSERALGAVAVR